MAASRSSSTGLGLGYVYYEGAAGAGAGGAVVGAASMDGDEGTPVSRGPGLVVGASRGLRGSIDVPPAGTNAARLDTTEASQTTPLFPFSPQTLASISFYSHLTGWGWG